MNKTKIELLESIEKDAQNLTYKDGNLGRVKKRAEMLVKKIFGNNSEYIDTLKKNQVQSSYVLEWNG